MAHDPLLIHPYYPIIYVRGYAFSQEEVNQTTEDPYMGFNLGATKRRREAYADTERFVFESPLVRLMKDYGYEDVYVAGTEDFTELRAQSIVVYRYYEASDTELGAPTTTQLLVGDLGGAEVMEQRAKGLAALMWQVVAGVCGDDADLQRMCRVHLVAHSMGGLICRCLLQKFGDSIRNADGISLVEKIFTYATPHNGVDAFGWNAVVPPYFRRPVMKQYLNLVNTKGKPLPGPVNTLNNTFPPERLFCLVGTNARDYDVASGFARRAAGEASDGLVKIDNAKVEGARFAEIHRSHSGPHGIVNSSEGYENLVRFLFGHVTVEGRVVIENAPQNPSGEGEYFVEATVATAGETDSNLTEKKKDHWSAQWRGSTDVLGTTGPPLFFVSFPKEGPHSEPTLFTVDLAISVSSPRSARSQALANQFLFRKTVALDIDRESLAIGYLFDDEAAFGGRQFSLAPLMDSAELPTRQVPLESANGFVGRLELRVLVEYDDTGASRQGRSIFGGGDSRTSARSRTRERIRTGVEAKGARA